MMEGYVKAHEKYYEKHPEVNGILLKERRKGKVTLVVGGGSGHEPLFAGLSEKGLQMQQPAEIFLLRRITNTIYETAKAVEDGQGVLFVYGNYAGDNLNFDMGEEMLNDDGIRTAHVRVWDDCASAPKERTSDRRGIAGDVFVMKIAGAACDSGADLEEVRRITEKARDSLRTIGVATAPGMIPGLEKQLLNLEKKK